MQDKRAGNVWVWVGVAVVVIAVILFFVWKPTPSKAPSTTQAMPQYAPQGQVVSGFPQKLILGTSPTVNSSYSIGYASSTNQYTAQWTSSSSVASMFSQYKTYLAANGWTISNQASVKSAATIYATDASSDVLNLAVTAQGSGSQMILSYVAR